MNHASFYKLPQTSTLAKWREATPTGFLFAAKASRYLTAEVMNDGLGDHCSEFRHARAEPRRDMSAVEGKISTAGSPDHSCFYEKT